MVRGRPLSYSESDIRLPRELSSSFFIELPSPPPPPPPSLHPAFVYVLHWSFHLSLIAMFETIFFWQFVAPSEDQALIDLIGNYTKGIFQVCATLSPVQQQSIRSLFELFINQTLVDELGTTAMLSRSAINWIFLRNSWLYFVSVFSLTLMLGTSLYIMRKPVKWRLVLLENIALIVMLGLYEWMFFHTVVFQYKSISIPELDKRVTDEFINQC